MQIHQNKRNIFKKPKFKLKKFASNKYEFKVTKN